METQAIPAWEIKNLVPLGSEIGFCINCMEQGRRERTWQLFRRNERISRIN